MSAYHRGNNSLEAYEVRILAALCRQNGGELRIKGELIDTTPGGVQVLKGWDTAKQELVLKVNMFDFPEIWVVPPVNQPMKEVVAADPLKKNGDGKQEELFAKKGSTLDNEKLAAMEQTLQKRRIASMLRDELQARRVSPRTTE